MDELHQAIKSSTFRDILIDVRTPFEVKETGIIKGALIKNVYDKDIELYVKKLDKKKTYVLYCHSGVRSAFLLDLLEKNKVKGMNLVGGIKAWRAKQYPLIKKIFK